MRRVLKNELGATAVDYLMITAVAAGVLFPVMYTKFGAPIQDTLFSKRDTLVAFFAQDRPHKKVPNTWFNKEPSPEINAGDIGEAGDVQDGDIRGADRVRAGDVGGAGDINVGDINSVGPIAPKDLGDAGRAGRGGTTGRGGIGGGGGGAGAGGRGGGDPFGSGGGDFFGGGGGKKGAQAEGNNEYGGSNARRTGTGYAGGAEFAEGGGGGKGKQSKKQQQSEGGKDEQSVAAFNKKTENFNMQRAKNFAERDESEIDWWMLIKIIILIFIIGFLILIFIGSRRR